MTKTFLLYLLRFFSKKIIKKYNPDIVGITGSVGKTSTKEAVASVLSARFNVRKTPKNYNNEIGLPLTVIGIEKSPGRSFFGWLKVFSKALGLIFIKTRKYPEILVLEMGADKPGDIKYLTQLAPCKVGVWTNVSHAHTENFKTLKKIILEKRVIISHLQKDGFAVLNFDNLDIMENENKTNAEIITFGTKEGADFQASEFRILIDENTGWPKGINFKVFHKGSSVPVLINDVVAEHLIYSSIAGLAVGIIFGINLVDGAEELKKTKPISGHMRLIEGIKNTLLIDDTYNSSPEAVKSGLKTISDLSAKRKIVVLGDMLELGTETENAHREIGFKVVEFGFDYLFTVGEASKLTAESAIEAGLKKDKVFKFSTAEEAGRFLQEKMEQGDLVFIKGSRGMKMEKIVKEVMAEPLEADNLLVG